MHYEGTVIRPPSEAHSIIFQVTLGCSHNRCTFCGAYRDKPFRIRSEEEIGRDIAFARRHCRRQKTVFLADGNALAIPHARLHALCRRIRQQLPWVRRISLYANSRDILRLREDQLVALRKLGLGRIYMGLESGHDPTLAAIGKGADSTAMVEAGRRVRRASIFLSVTCLLGIAGTEDSQAHARATAAVINRMRPSQVAVLTLMLLDNTELGRRARQGRFRLPDRMGLCRELHTLIRDLDLRAQFQANHASNYFVLNGRLPRDQKKFLATVEQALAGSLQFTPEAQRAL
ncbi:MAG TPA: radical SAM protein [Desulfobulbus sp.]|nr:radical SAM protein [Desulfobulbus sp.]